MASLDLFEKTAPAAARVSKRYSTNRLEFYKHACEALGFDFQDAVRKSKEEMYDSSKLPEANELIYSHYLKRYNWKLSQIQAKAQELILLDKSKKEQVNQQKRMKLKRATSSLEEAFNPQLLQRRNSAARHRPQNDSVIKSMKHNHSQISCRVSSNAENSLLSDIEINDKEIGGTVIDSYKKKLDKAKNQWHEEASRFKNLPINDPEDLLKHTLKQQVRRLNRSMEIADKYAQSIIEETNKKKTLREELIEKEKKTKQVLNKLEKERVEKVKKKHEFYSEKSEDIKALKKEFNMNMRRHATSLKKRFQELDDKAAQRESERTSMIRTRSLEFSGKILRVTEQKTNEYEQLFEDFLEDQSRVERNLENRKEQQRMKCEASAKQYQENSDKVRAKREVLLSERKARTIEGLIKKSQGTEQIRKIICQSLKKKAKETTEKETKHQESYNEVKKTKRKWITDVVMDMKKTEEQVKEHNEEKTKQLILKKELNSLKKQDQLENIGGLKKLQEAKNVQILEKDRADRLKQILLKEQCFLLSQARIDVDRQVKIKIDKMLNSVTKNDDKSGLVPGHKKSRSSSIKL